jgi:hypothetical protein
MQAARPSTAPVRGPARLASVKTPAKLVAFDKFKLEVTDGDSWSTALAQLDPLDKQISDGVLLDGVADVTAYVGQLVHLLFGLFLLSAVVVVVVVVVVVFF